MLLQLFEVYKHQEKDHTTHPCSKYWKTGHNMFSKPTRCLWLDQTAKAACLPGRATESTTLGQSHITSQLPHATIKSWINESMTKKIWECKKEIARGKILHHPSKFHNIGTSSSKTSIESTTALALGSTCQVMASLVARFVWGTTALKRRRLQPGQTLPAQAQPPPGETFMGIMGLWPCFKRHRARERERESERGRDVKEGEKKMM